MELKFIERKEAQDERGNYKRDEYRIGNYVVFREMSFYNTGSIFDRIQVIQNREVDYIPEIYFNYDIFGEKDTREFKIQTTSYGSLSPEEIQKVIAGYNEALEVVNILTEKFIKQEDPQNGKCNLS